jgi:D-alanyl-D-alanine carboxypeptidase
MQVSSFKKNSIFPIASTAKLITILYSLELVKDNPIYTIPLEATSVNGSKVFLKEGDKIYFHDLIKASIISSANDATLSIAINTEKSEKVFLQKANEWLKQNNFKSTNLADVNGLSKKTVSNAEEILAIFKLAYENPFLENILHTKETEIVSVNRKKIPLKSKILNIKLPVQQNLFGKFGYTYNARHCFVGVIEHKNQKYFLSILGAKDAWKELIFLVYNTASF